MHEIIVFVSVKKNFRESMIRLGTILHQLQDVMNSLIIFWKEDLNLKRELENSLKILKSKCGKEGIFTEWE